MNIVIIFSIIILIAAVYIFFFRKNRNTQLQELVPKLGLSEIERTPLGEKLGDLDDFLFPNGVSCTLAAGEQRKRKIGLSSGWRIKNSSGELFIADLTISVRYLNADASATTDSLSRESQQYGMPLTQTVLCYRLENRTLPRFFIAERLPFEQEYLSVNGSDQVGGHYRICAQEADKTSVGCLLGEATLELLASERLWSIESHGDRVFVYQRNWLAPAGKLEAFMNTGNEIVKDLVYRSQNNSSSE